MSLAGVQVFKTPGFPPEANAGMTASGFPALL
jgi:hypothetical protein